MLPGSRVGKLSLFSVAARMWRNNQLAGQAREHRRTIGWRLKTDL